MFPKRKRDTHKGTYGHSMFIGGSPGLTGAPVLAAEGAILSGAGRVTCIVPERLNVIFEIKLTEAMTYPVRDRGRGYFNSVSHLPVKRFIAGASAVGIGPGLGSRTATQRFVRAILAHSASPVIIDADALNALRGYTHILRNVPGECVITPHPGEMARLMECAVADVQKDRTKTALRFARRYGVITVLKGHRTVVASPRGKLYLNKTGNPGMATAGTGDILTGIITACAGQGISAFEAASRAVFIHGVSGDLAVRDKGETSLRARDILAYLPRAFIAAAGSKKK